MKISRSTIHVLVVLEAIVLIVVIALSVIHPWAAPKKHDLEHVNTEDLNNDNIIPEFTEPVYSEEIVAMVEDMTLEQKVAQMFITTEEELSATEDTDKLSKKRKNAIKKYTFIGEEMISTYEDGGIRVSDDWMENNEAENNSDIEVAVVAVQTGVEMLYCTEDLPKAYMSILDAVEDGVIEEETIDSAVIRILTCKEELEDE